MRILDLVTESGITGPARYELVFKALSVCDLALKGDDRDTAMAAVTGLVEREKSKQDIDSRANAARLVG